jgi:hypothetical protein
MVPGITYPLRLHVEELHHVVEYSIIGEGEFGEGAIARCGGSESLVLLLLAGGSGGTGNQ